MPGKQLNPRYLRFHPSAPANTAIAAPVSVAMDLGGSIQINEVHIVIPRGHGGLTGIRIDYSGATILPAQFPPVFMIGNNWEKAFDMGLFEVESPLTVVLYNLDNRTHVWDITVKISDRIVPIVGTTSTAVHL